MQVLRYGEMSPMVALQISGLWVAFFMKCVIYVLHFKGRILINCIKMCRGESMILFLKYTLDSWSKSFKAVSSKKPKKGQTQTSCFEREDLCFHVAITMILKSTANSSAVSSLYYLQSRCQVTWKSLIASFPSPNMRLLSKIRLLSVKWVPLMVKWPN